MNANESEFRYASLDARWTPIPARKAGNIRYCLVDQQKPQRLKCNK